jgi:hypothetical protein
VIGQPIALEFGFLFGCKHIYRRYSGLGSRCNRHQFAIFIVPAAHSKPNTKPAWVLNNNIQVFPSPASNNVFVKVNGMDKATVQIYNASGQEVGKAVMSTKDLWQVDVSEFAPGVYFVVVKDSKGTIEKGVFVKE